MAQKKDSSKTEERKRKIREKARRRRFITTGIVIGFLLIAALTFGVVQQRARDVYDLSVVGQGVPVVVQVHDTTCPICVELRNTIEQIDSDYSQEDLLIRVADVSNPQAVSFIAPYTTNRRVTLLFFDGQGTLVDTLVGAQTSLALREAFRSLISTSQMR